MKKIAANRNYKIAANFSGAGGEAHAEGSNVALGSVLQELSRAGRLRINEEPGSGSVVASILSGLLGRGFSLVAGSFSGESDSGPSPQ